MIFSPLLPALQKAARSVEEPLGRGHLAGAAEAYSERARPAELKAQRYAPSPSA